MGAIIRVEEEMESLRQRYEQNVDSPASVVLPHERGRLKRNATDFSAKISTLVNASFQDVSSSSRERTARNGFNRNESQSPRGPSFISVVDNPILRQYSTGVQSNSSSRNRSQSPGCFPMPVSVFASGSQISSRATLGVTSPRGHHPRNVNSLGVTPPVPMQSRSSHGGEVVAQIVQHVSSQAQMVVPSVAVPSGNITPPIPPITAVKEGSKQNKIPGATQLHPFFTRLTPSSAALARPKYQES